MPYIKKEAREKFENEINLLVENINEPGELNYVIYKILVGLIKKLGMSYRISSSLITELECCKLEFYRRILAPYEDLKRKENGDVK
jgi:hypothetical protein